MRVVDLAFPAVRHEDLVLATLKSPKDWLNSALALVHIFTVALFASLALTWLALRLLWFLSATAKRTPRSKFVGKTATVISALMTVVFVGLFRGALVARLLTRPRGQETFI